MSGLDPLAAFALQAVASAQAAIEESALNLGALLSQFQAQVSVGDILTATVLPPQNGTDRLSLLGQTIDAQLPPGINPGETLALKVTGFTNTAILVRNLGAVDPDTLPPQPAAPETAPSSADVPPPLSTPPQTPQTPQTAILRSRGAPEPTTVTPPPPRPIQPPPQRGAVPPVAPPRELFVAASVRPTAAAPASPADAHEPVAGASPELEARIVATRASTTIGSPPPALAPKAAPLQKNAASPPASASAQAAVTRASVERALVAGAVRSATPSLQTGGLPQTPQATLLAHLRVPVSATTLAAARIVDTATHHLTSAFEKLDALLARAGADPRTSTMRSTLAFVSRFDLRNTRALPEQIASFVSNVVTGSESKIAQIVRALTQAVPDAAPGASVPAASRPEVAAPANVQAAPATAATVAERMTALDHDLKASLLQLVQNPPQGSSPQVIAALRDALTATTAVQLNALAAQDTNPSAITIALPAYFYQGGQPAQLRISRDAPNAKNVMDADNFHVAFILDTKSLGTVAIDVQTAGRSVSVDVRTETPRSADRFRTTFNDLRGRLEGLQYRVAGMASGLAARANPEPAREQAAQAPPARTSNVDMQA